MNIIRTVLGFDMETDIGSWTPWYKGFKPGTEMILGVLKKNAVTATFFFTADAAQKNPEIVKMVGRGSIYVDVFGCTNLEECWDPAHPQSRRDDLNARREILQYIADQFGSITTESAPTEALADIVTMGAFCSFFNSFSIPASAEMPIAVPFWQLVFHDSVLGTTCPMNNLKLEDYYPILALYGLLPLALDPESLKLSRELRSAYKAEMVHHQFLTPVKNSYQAVARTDFSDGTSVWANLTDQAYEADGISLPHHSFEIRTCEKSR